jgi:hypothetical protein
MTEPTQEVRGEYAGKEDHSIPVNEMLWNELCFIGRHDELSPPPPLKEIYRQLGENDAEGLSALCFSGGGIRSATFNLGVIQALAKHKLLDKFDYLSSVSGGGYIAAWLKAWLRRAPMDEVLEALAEPTKDPGFRPLAPEPKPLDHLREYSNYLTPRTGLFSADTWAAAATVIRNLILNWLVLVPVLAACIAIPQAALIVASATQADEQLGGDALALAMIVEVLASVAVYHFRRQSGSRAKESTILVCAVVPIWCAGLLLALAGLWLRPEENPVEFAYFCAIWCILIPLVGWVLSLISTGRNPIAVTWRSDAFGILLSGIVTAALLFVVGDYLLAPLRATPPVFVILAVPILLSIYLFARAMYVAFASIGESRRVTAPGEPTGAAWAEADREWWARLSGWVLIMIIAWTSTSALIVLGYYYVDMFVGRVAALLGGVTGLITALLGAGPGTSGTVDPVDKAKHSPIRQLVLTLLTPLTIASIIVALAQLNAWLGQQVTGIDTLLRIDGKLLHETVHLSTGQILLRFSSIPIALLLASGLLGFVVNINRFSAHGLYRNRLVRAYLGASHLNRDADTDPFTGFNVLDDIPLHDLERGDSKGRLFPVINVALNLVRSAEHLAWQQRKAESFSMTPLHCGNFFEGYRSSKEYGGANGVGLGTAITISGAAANPSAGYHSSPLVSFLMTLFNVRLGCWLGNTNVYGEEVYRYNGPRHAWNPLFGDLLGFTDAAHAYVNLSDGGHFENLGVYEMVLRRCRFIVAGDADQDPEFGLQDLGNLIRKVRIDFGIDIDFDQPIRILARDDKSSGNEGLICALGTIRYDRVDPGAAPGFLLYIKPTLRAKGSPLPYDIFSYSRASTQFPHEPTSDQWFSEAQFESYRALGERLVEQLADQIKGGVAFTDVPSFFTAVKKNFLKAKPIRPEVDPDDRKPA